jgi:carboxynorspermidine decarboxylase
MSKHQPLNFDPATVETPSFVVDLGLLRQNLELLASVQERAGCKVLLALKGFSMFSTFDLVRQYLSGCCASGLHEALLAREEFNKEVHVYAPAFKEAEMRQIIPIANHISFNSFREWKKWKPMLDAARAQGHAPSPGIRVNPEHSEVEVAIYDPCSPGCRLGARAVSLAEEDLEGLEGLHFHALCEQDSDVLERTLAAVEKRFPWLLERVKWVNMGGGHHITRPGYDVERLIRVVQDFRSRWGKTVYLEPGEAVALNTGFLITSVMDVVGESTELVRVDRLRVKNRRDSRPGYTAGVEGLDLDADGRPSSGPRPRNSRRSESRWVAASESPSRTRESTAGSPRSRWIAVPSAARASSRGLRASGLDERLLEIVPGGRPRQDRLLLHGNAQTPFYSGQFSQVFIP